MKEKTKQDLRKYFEEKVYPYLKVNALPIGVCFIFSYLFLVILDSALWIRLLLTVGVFVAVNRSIGFKQPSNTAKGFNKKQKVIEAEVVEK